MKQISKKNKYNIDEISYSAISPQNSYNIKHNTHNKSKKQLRVDFKVSENYENVDNKIQASTKVTLNEENCVELATIQRHFSEHFNFDPNLHIYFYKDDDVWMKMESEKTYIFGEKKNRSRNFPEIVIKLDNSFSNNEANSGNEMTENQTYKEKKKISTNLNLLIVVSPKKSETLFLARVSKCIIDSVQEVLIRNKKLFDFEKRSNFTTSDNLLNVLERKSRLSISDSYNNNINFPPNNSSFVKEANNNNFATNDLKESQVDILFIHSLPLFDSVNKEFLNNRISNFDKEFHEFLQTNYNNKIIIKLITGNNETWPLDLPNSKITHLNVPRIVYHNNIAKLSFENNGDELLMSCQEFKKYCLYRDNEVDCKKKSLFSYKTSSSSIKLRRFSSANKIRENEDHNNYNYLEKLDKKQILIKQRSNSVIKEEKYDDRSLDDNGYSNYSKLSLPHIESHLSYKSEGYNSNESSKSNILDKSIEECLKKSIAPMTNKDNENNNENLYQTTEVNPELLLKGSGNVIFDEKMKKCKTTCDFVKSNDNKIMNNNRNLQLENVDVKKQTRFSLSSNIQFKNPNLLSTISKSQRPSLDCHLRFSDSSAFYLNNLPELMVVVAKNAEMISGPMFEVNSDLKFILCINSTGDAFDDLNSKFSSYFYKYLLEGKTINYSFNMAISIIEVYSKMHIHTCCCFHHHKPGCLFICHETHEKVCKTCQKLNSNEHYRFCPEGIAYNDKINILRQNTIKLNFENLYSDNDNSDKLNEKEIANAHEVLNVCCCLPNIPHSYKRRFNILYRNNDMKLKNYVLFSNLTEKTSMKILGNNVRLLPDIDISYDPYLVGRLSEVYQAYSYIMRLRMSNENISRKKRIITFLSNRGIGKTVICKLISRYLWERNVFKNILFIKKESYKSIEDIREKIIKFLGVDIFDKETQTNNQYNFENVDNLIIIEISNNFVSFEEFLELFDLLIQFDLLWIFCICNESFNIPNEKVINIKELEYSYVEYYFRKLLTTEQYNSLKSTSFYTNTLLKLVQGNLNLINIAVKLTKEKKSYDIITYEIKQLSEVYGVEEKDFKSLFSLLFKDCPHILIIVTLVPYGISDNSFDDLKLPFILDKKAAVLGKLESMKIISKNSKSNSNESVILPLANKDEMLKQCLKKCCEIKLTNKQKLPIEQEPSVIFHSTFKELLKFYKNCIKSIIKSEVKITDIYNFSLSLDYGIWRRIITSYGTGLTKNKDRKKLKKHHYEEKDRIIDNFLFFTDKLLKNDHSKELINADEKILSCFTDIILGIKHMINLGLVNSKNVENINHQLNKFNNIFYENIEKYIYAYVRYSIYDAFIEKKNIEKSKYNFKGAQYKLLSQAVEIEIDLYQIFYDCICEYKKIKEFNYKEHNKLLSRLENWSNKLNEVLNKMQNIISGNFKSEQPNFKTNVFPSDYVHSNNMNNLNANNTNSYKIHDIDLKSSVEYQTLSKKYFSYQIQLANNSLRVKNYDNQPFSDNIVLPESQIGHYSQELDRLKRENNEQVIFIMTKLKVECVKIDIEIKKLNINNLKISMHLNQYSYLRDSLHNLFESFTYSNTKNYNLLIWVTKTYQSIFDPNDESSRKISSMMCTKIEDMIENGEFNNEWEIEKMFDELLEKINHKLNLHCQNVIRIFYSQPLIFNEDEEANEYCKDIINVKDKFVYLNPIDILTEFLRNVKVNKRISIHDHIMTEENLKTNLPKNGRICVFITDYNNLNQNEETKNSSDFDSTIIKVKTNDGLIIENGNKIGLGKIIKSISKLLIQNSTDRINYDVVMICTLNGDQLLKEMLSENFDVKYFVTFNIHKELLELINISNKETLSHIMLEFVKEFSLEIMKIEQYIKIKKEFMEDYEHNKDTKNTDKLLKKNSFKNIINEKLVVSRHVNQDRISGNLINIKNQLNLKNKKKGLLLSEKNLYKISSKDDVNVFITKRPTIEAFDKYIIREKYRLMKKAPIEMAFESAKVSFYHTLLNFLNKLPVYPSNFKIGDKDSLDNNELLEAIFELCIPILHSNKKCKDQNIRPFEDGQISTIKQTSVSVKLHGFTPKKNFDALYFRTSEMYNFINNLLAAKSNLSSGETTKQILDKNYPILNLYGLEGIGKFNFLFTALNYLNKRESLFNNNFNNRIHIVNMNLFEDYLNDEELQRLYTQNNDSDKNFKNLPSYLAILNKLKLILKDLTYSNTSGEKQQIAYFPYDIIIAFCSCQIFIDNNLDELLFELISEVLFYYKLKNLIPKIIVSTNTKLNSNCLKKSFGLKKIERFNLKQFSNGSLLNDAVETFVFSQIKFNDKVKFTKKYYKSILAFIKDEVTKKINVFTPKKLCELSQTLSVKINSKLLSKNDSKISLISISRLLNSHEKVQSINELKSYKSSVNHKNKTKCDSLKYSISSEQCYNNEKLCKSKSYRLNFNKTTSQDTVFNENHQSLNNIDCLSSLSHSPNNISGMNFISNLSSDVQCSMNTKLAFKMNLDYRGLDVVEEIDERDEKDYILNKNLKLSKTTKNTENNSKYLLAKFSLTTAKLNRITIENPEISETQRDKDDQHTQSLLPHNALFSDNKSNENEENTLELFRNKNSNEIIEYKRCTSIPNNFEFSIKKLETNIDNSNNSNFRTKINEMLNILDEVEIDSNINDSNNVFVETYKSRVKNKNDTINQFRKMSIFEDYTNCSPFNKKELFMKSLMELNEKKSNNVNEKSTEKSNISVSENIKSVSTIPVLPKTTCNTNNSNSINKNKDFNYRLKNTNNENNYKKLKNNDFNKDLKKNQVKLYGSKEYVVDYELGTNKTINLQLNTNILQKLNTYHCKSTSLDLNYNKNSKGHNDKILNSLKFKSISKINNQSVKVSKNKLELDFNLIDNTVNRNNLNSLSKNFK